MGRSQKVTGYTEIESGVFIKKGGGTKVYVRYPDRPKEYDYRIKGTTYDQAIRMAKSGNVPLKFRVKGSRGGGLRVDPHRAPLSERAPPRKFKTVTVSEPYYKDQQVVTAKAELTTAAAPQRSRAAQRQVSTGLSSLRPISQATAAKAEGIRGGELQPISRSTAAKATRLREDFQAREIARQYSEADKKERRVFPSDAKRVGGLIEGKEGKYWVPERGVAGGTQIVSKKVTEKGKVTYDVSEQGMTVKENGQLKRVTQPPGKSVTTKVVVSKRSYSVYEDGQLKQVVPAGEGMGFDIGSVRGDYEELGFDVKQTNGTVTATFVAVPKFDLEATAAEARAKGLQVTKTDKGIRVVAPIKERITESSFIPGKEDYIVARKATGAEKWIGIGTERAKAVGELPVLKDIQEFYLKKEGRSVSGVFPEIDKAAGRVDRFFKPLGVKVGTFAGGVTKTFVGLPLAPGGLLQTGAKAVTIAEAAVTDPTGFQDWTRTSVKGLPKAQEKAIKFAQEHPEVVAGMIVGAVGTAVVTSALTSYALKGAHKYLTSVKSTQVSKVSILDRADDIAYYKAETRATSPTLFGDVRSVGKGAGEIQVSKLGYYRGSSEYFVATKTPKLTGTRLDAFRGMDTTLGAGYKVLKTPQPGAVVPTKSFIGNIFDDSFIHLKGGVEKAFKVTPQAKSFGGFAISETSKDITTRSMQVSRLFFEGRKVSIYDVFTKGVTRGGIKSQTVGKLTVKDVSPLPPLVREGGEGIFFTTAATGGSQTRLFGAAATGAAERAAAAQAAGALEIRVVGTAAEKAAAETARQITGIKQYGAGVGAASLAGQFRAQEVKTGFMFPKQAPAQFQELRVDVDVFRKAGSLQLPQVRQVTEKIPILQQVTKTRQTTTKKAPPQSLQLQLQVQAPGQEIIPIQIQPQELLPIQVTPTRQTQVSRYDLGIPGGFMGASFIEGFPFPFPIPEPRSIGGGGGGAFGFDFARMRKTAYQPSLAAKFADISIEQPFTGFLTGLEVRPTVVPKKKKKKRGR